MQKIKISIFLVILVIFLDLCLTNSYGLTPSKSYIKKEVKLKKPDPSVLQATKYLPLSECKLKESELPESASNMFRTGISNLEPKELIKVIVMFVDFSDLESSILHEPSIGLVTDHISEYFAAISNGQIRFKWLQEKSIARMPKSLVEYGVGSRQDLNQAVQIIRDAQTIAFSTYSHEDFNYFIVVSPPEISHSQLSTSVSLLQSESEFINSTLLANDFWRSGMSWVIPAHEIGHAMGLLDLYSYESAENVIAHPSLYQTQFLYMQYFDLMNWPTGPAPEMNAWNRWELGLLKFDQVKCLPSSVTETNLVALEGQDFGAKALFLKLDEFRIIVIENRQAIGFDRALPNSARGVIIYLVNLRVKSGLGPQRLLHMIQRKSRANALALPEHVVQEIGGYGIECLGYYKFRARIRVSSSLLSK